MDGDIFGMSILIIIMLLVIGVVIGQFLQANTYNKQILICAKNNFTYEKCAELYNWNLKEMKHEEN